MRIPAIAFLVTLGCTLSKPVGNGVGTDGTDGGESGGGSASMSSTTAASTTGAVDESGESGAAGNDLYVDCAEATPGWPTVGGGNTVSPLGFPDFACNPRESGEALGYRCCSDDPAAPGGALPAYLGWPDVGEPPLFADENNQAGAWGMCVKTTDIPPGFTLNSEEAAGCPRPCDPAWSPEQVATLCGDYFRCCQTFELQPEDCVLDPQTNSWRPVTGDDVFQSVVVRGTVQQVTTWSPSSHATHQDPGGTMCAELFGDGGAAWEDCMRQLHVADRRGYCMSVASCPGEDPAYVDACEAMNL